MSKYRLKLCIRFHQPFQAQVSTESTDKGDMHERCEITVRQKLIQSNEKQTKILVSFLLINSFITFVVCSTFVLRKRYKTFLFTLIY